MTLGSESPSARSLDRSISALARVRSELGREYNLVIGGEQIRTTGKIKSINPAFPAEVVGIHQKAEAEHADRAMQAALKAFESWKNVPIEERASLLFRAAQIIRERKYEFCAWLVFEVGKNYGEADGDVCEAIDFLEFYAREALRLAESIQHAYAGKVNGAMFELVTVGPDWTSPKRLLGYRTPFGKLRHLDDWNTLRRKHAETYRRLLAGTPLTLPLP